MKQPKLLFLLATAQGWKFFSHYGIRALLVLYLVEQKGFSDSHAFGINALFIALVELAGIFGGLLADRYLGLRRAFMLGAPVLALGYGSLLFEKGLFLSLGLIVLGGGLFGSNITALLGEAYEKDDPRRKKGFTFFYMGQNLGALLSTAVCSVLALKYGFKVGFGLAASGMVIGCALLWIKRDLLSKVGEAPRKPKISLLLVPGGILLVAFAGIISQEKIMLPIIPWVTLGLFVYFAVKLARDPDLPKKKIYLLFVYLGALILFFAAEDQLFSSLMIFAQSGAFLSLNPIVILLLGPLIAKFRFRLIIPFLITALAFATLQITSVFGLIVALSVAELMIGPMIMTFASEVAVKGKAGMVMGMIPIAFSLAFMLGGGMSKMVALDEGGYGSGFIKLAVAILVGGILLELLKKRFSYESHVHE